MEQREQVERLVHWVIGKLAKSGALDASLAELDLNEQEQEMARASFLLAGMEHLNKAHIPEEFNIAQAAALALRGRLTPP